MASLKDESLFSLELVVDKLTIPDTTCRFPAVAFRLLDFPTLIIYHVEPELGDTIKIKIRGDPYYKLGRNFSELLDKDGSYSIKKGKSCLLKISSDMLLSHLSSTPLYVMVIDTYPEVPKLIGNCTVPLDTVMDSLYDDICKEGLAVPTVRGEKGAYKIYNLMGTHIGGIVLGMRLLSLGVGLIPHLPAASSTLPKQVKSHDIVTVASKAEKDKIQEQVADTVLKELDVPTVEAKLAPKPMQQNFVSLTDKMQIKIQSEEEILRNIATQTERRRKEKKRTEIRRFTDPLDLNVNIIDDIVVTNTLCPPPLFYNSEAENNNAYTMKFLDGMSDDLVSAQSFSETSDDDTIRPEDWKSESDEDIENQQKINNSIRKKKQPKLNEVAVRTKSSRISSEKKIKSFPLLNALMKEITALQGGDVQDSTSNLQTDIYVEKPPKFPPRTRPLSPQTSKMPSVSRPHSPGRERESVEKYLTRVSTPRNTVRELPTPQSSRTSLREPKKPLKTHRCQEAPKGVPKHRSWIRQVPPPMSVQKTKLLCGMTNTQRLRLERSNPELLRTLEEKEKERIEKWKQQKRLQDQKNLAEGTFGTIDSVVYGLDGHRIDNEAYENHRDIHKKPVPTPRVHHGEYEEQLQEQQPSERLHPENDEPNYEDSYRDSQEDEETFGGYEWEQNTHDSNLDSENETDGKLHDVSNQEDKKYASPGFPVTDSVEDDKLSSSVHHGDGEQYEPSKNPVAKSVVNRASIDAGEALGLRKIVDKYSDEESQDSFKSAKSHSSYKSEETQYIPSTPRNDATRLGRSKKYSQITGPKVSVTTPKLAHGKSSNYKVTKTAESAATIEASVDSTAYISRSQVLSQQSSQLNESNDSAGDYRYAKARHTTESVSSYNGEDNDDASMLQSGVSQITPAGNYEDYDSDSFDDESEPFVQVAKSVDEAKLAPEAKFGYTWHY